MQDGPSQGCRCPLVVVSGLDLSQAKRKTQFRTRTKAQYCSPVHGKLFGTSAIHESSWVMELLLRNLGRFPEVRELTFPVFDEVTSHEPSGIHALLHRETMDGVSICESKFLYGYNFPYLRHAIITHSRN